MSVRRREIALTALVAAVFGAGPTVGDIGSCGSVAQDLDEASFGKARKALDCDRCSECGLATQTCKSACDPSSPSTVAWPMTCHPLEHDGEVCLRALQAASCTAYARFVDDVAPTVPTECDFCHLDTDAGAGAVP